MFYADVTDIEPEHVSQDGSFFESVSQNQWQPLEYLNQGDYGDCQLGYFQLKSLLKL
jgi:8-oxo-dGTP diphosphatase